MEERRLEQERLAEAIVRELTGARFVMPLVDETLCLLESRDVAPGTAAAASPVGFASVARLLSAMSPFLFSPHSLALLTALHPITLREEAESDSGRVLDSIVLQSFAERRNDLLAAVAARLGLLPSDPRPGMLVLMSAFHPRTLETFSCIEDLEAGPDAALARICDAARDNPRLRYLFRLPANAARIALLGLRSGLLDQVAPGLPTWQQLLKMGSLPMSLVFGLDDFVPAISLLSVVEGLECHSQLRAMELGGLVNSGEAFEQLVANWLVVRSQCVRHVKPVGHDMNAAVQRLQRNVASWLQLEHAGAGSVWDLPPPRLNRVEGVDLDSNADAAALLTRRPGAVLRPHSQQEGFDLLLLNGQGAIAVQLKSKRLTSEVGATLDALTLVQAARNTAKFLRPLRRRGLRTGFLVISTQTVAGTAARLAGAATPSAGGDADWELLLAGNDHVAGVKSPLRTRADDDADAGAGAAAGDEVRGRGATAAKRLTAGDVLRRDETLELLRNTRIIDRDAFMALLGPSLSLLIGPELDESLVRDTEAAAAAAASEP
jgi:hypothetical protein